MRKFRVKQGDLYISQERINERPLFRGPEYHWEERFGDLFWNRPLFWQYIDLYGRLTGLPKTALLEAHGGNKDEWVFYDGPNGEKEVPVQRWIDDVDGRYSALLFCVCNPGSHTPHSRKSILVVPDFDVDFTGGTDRKSTSYTLLVPGIGEVDSYTIRYEIDQLRRRCV